MHSQLFILCILNCLYCAFSIVYILYSDCNYKWNVIINKYKNMLNDIINNLNLIKIRGYVTSSINLLYKKIYLFLYFCNLFIFAVNTFIICNTSIANSSSGGKNWRLS